MMFLRNIKYVIIFVQASYSLISEEFPSEMLIDLHKYCNTRAISFIFTDTFISRPKLLWQLVKLIRSLSVRGVEASALHYKKLITGLGSQFSTVMQTLLFPDYGKEVLNQVSLFMTQKHSTWLLYVERNISIGKLMGDIHIPLDSRILVAQQTQYHFQLARVYNIAQKQYVKKFGTWDHQAGLQIPSHSLYHGKSDLHGVEIKATSVQGPPMTIINKKSMKISGFIGDLWTELEHRLNFTTQLRVPADNVYGSMAKNGTWNGMISLLIKGESEVGVGDFTISSSRAQAVDFTVHVAESTLTTFIRRSTNPDVGWTDFLNPFSADLWLADLIVMSIMAISFKFIRRKVSLSFSIHHITSIFCQQGGAEKNSGYASSFITLATSMTVLVLYAAYSANLISFLAVQIYILPFASLEELLQRGDFQIDVIISSALFTELQETTNPVLKNVYERYIKNNPHLPSDTLCGLNRVCNRNKYAFVTSELIANFMKENVTCSLEVIPGRLMKETLALAVSKNSSYLDILSHNLLILREDGTLRRIEEQFWPQLVPTAEDSWHGVEILDVISVFAMHCFGIFISLLVLFLEIIYYYARSKKRASNNNFDEQCTFLP